MSGGYMNELIKAATGSLWQPACALTRHVIRHLKRHVSRHVNRQSGLLQACSAQRSCGISVWHKIAGCTGSGPA
jgi:hypothetical protein